MKLAPIFLLIWLPFSASSQVELGVRSGVAFSKQKFDNYGFPPHLSKHIEGVELGATLNWFFLPSFFLQPELNFIQKGGDYSNRTIKINCLEAAVSLGFERKCERLSLFLNSGVYIDRIINKIMDRPVGNNIEDYDWGWGLMHGGGAAIPIGKGWIGLAGRYRYSLSGFRKAYATDINGERIPGQDPIIIYKNKGWSINLFYKIDIQ